MNTYIAVNNMAKTKGIYLEQALEQILGQSASNLTDHSGREKARSSARKKKQQQPTTQPPPP